MANIPINTNINLVHGILLLGFHGGASGKKKKQNTQPTCQCRRWVQSLGQEDPLEEGMAIHSSFLDWKILGQRSLVGHSPQGHKESDTTEATAHSAHPSLTTYIDLKFFKKPGGI